MNRGNIKIIETEHLKFVVEVKFADGNLWLTKHEIADLFNVTISTVSNSLRSILKLEYYKRKKLPAFICLIRMGNNAKRHFTVWKP